MGASLPCLRALTHNLFKQRLIAVHHVVDDIVATYSLKMLPGAINFRLFNWGYMVKFETVKRALRFRDEIYMFYCAFIECDCPVGVIAADGSRYVEAAWQLDVDGDVLIGIELGREVALFGRIIDDVVVKVTPGLL